MYPGVERVRWILFLVLCLIMSPVLFTRLEIK